jgi:hypothetical protein
LVAICLAGLLGGCGQLFSWKSSGIPDALNTENLISKAGAPLGIKLSLGGSERSWHESHLLTQRHFHATLSTGTRRQLLAAYQTEVKRAIEGKWATIGGSGTSGSEGELSDWSGFSYGYTWGRNNGIVRVYSFDATDGAVEVISLCYEHHE